MQSTTMSSGRSRNDQVHSMSNYKNVPKEIAVLKTASFGQFSLPEEEQLIQEN